MKGGLTYSETEKDSLKFNMDLPEPPPGPGNHIFNFLYGVDSLQDPLRKSEIDSAYKLALQKQKLDIPFTIIEKNGKEESDGPTFSSITIGLTHPVTYTLELGNTLPYLIKRITLPIQFLLL